MILDLSGRVGARDARIPIPPAARSARQGTSPQEFDKLGVPNKVALERRWLLAAAALPEGDYAVPKKIRRQVRNTRSRRRLSQTGPLKSPVINHQQSLCHSCRPPNGQPYPDADGCVGTASGGFFASPSQCWAVLRRDAACLKRKGRSFMQCITSYSRTALPKLPIHSPTMDCFRDRGEATW